MNRKTCYILGVLAIALGLGFGVTNLVSAEQLSPQSLIAAVTSAPPAQTKPATNEMPEAKNADRATIKESSIIDYIDPIIIIKNPTYYLNKKVNMVARFDKFATLGLDYKPAYRSSEQYISFLIFRTDTDKNIPLSEMKLFVKRDVAEKLIDLKEGDKVQFAGTVFSTALGDAWVDAENLKKLD